MGCTAGRRSFDNGDVPRKSSLLTGTLGSRARAGSIPGTLGTILGDESRAIDCSQLNELLLLVHKDRIENPFFEYFFGSGCTIGQIAAGVERFQKTALWLYGNFVFAYRKLSRIKEAEEFRETISEVAKDPSVELKYFQRRQRKLLEVDQIDKEQTPFVGYLSGREIRADFGRCDLLWKEAGEIGPAATWEQYLGQIYGNGKSEREGTARRHHRELQNPGVHTLTFPIFVFF